jgi:hypothetical protein
MRTKMMKGTRARGGVVSSVLRMGSFSLLGGLPSLAISYFFLADNGPYTPVPGYYRFLHIQGHIQSLRRDIFLYTFLIYLHGRGRQAMDRIGLDRD